MQRNIWSSARMTPTLTHGRGAWPGLLLLLAMLVFLAACGSNGTTTGSTAPTAASSPTATSGSGNSSGNGYGRYGSGSKATVTPTTATTGPTQTVMIALSSGNFAFSPATLTIPVGTTVIWMNTTGVSHTVTSDDKTTFNSGTATPVNPGATFTFKFTKSGTYKYHCNFHPYMVATIIVQ